MAWRAVEVLRRQPEVWQHIAACLPDTAQRNLALADALDQDGGSDGEAEQAEAWEGSAGVAWRLAAEAHALQLITFDAFLRRPTSKGAHQHTMLQCQVSKLRLLVPL